MEEKTKKKFKTKLLNLHRLIRRYFHFYFTHLDHIEARGLLKQLNSLDTCFISLVWYDILERFNSVSSILQSTKTKVCSIVDLYDSLIEFLSFMKYDFTKYETKAKELCGKDFYQPDLNQPKKQKLFMMKECRKMLDNRELEVKICRLNFLTIYYNALSHN